MISNNNLTPFRVWLKRSPRYPYQGIVWARSKTAAINLFAAHLAENNYRLHPKSVSSYDTLKLTKGLANGNKDPITLFQEVRT